MMNKRVYWLAIAVLALGLAPAWAQEPAGAMKSMSGMDQGGQAGTTQDTGQDMSNMNQGGGMDMGMFREVVVA